MWRIYKLELLYMVLEDVKDPDAFVFKYVRATYRWMRLLITISLFSILHKTMFRKYSLKKKIVQKLRSSLVQYLTI